MSSGTRSFWNWSGQSLRPRHGRDRAAASRGAICPVAPCRAHRARGWIARRRAPGQGRGQILSLTPAGRGLHDRIWQIYREAIHEELGARLSHEEGYALAALLIRLYP